MWRNENKSRVYMRMQSKWASEFDKSISFQQQYWICMIIAAIPKIPHVLYTLNSTPLDERERERFIIVNIYAGGEMEENDYDDEHYT